MKANKFEIFVRSTDKKFVTKHYKSVSAESHIEAVKATMGTDIKKTDFFRRSSDAQGREVVKYDGLFKSAPTKRSIEVIQIAIAEAAPAAAVATSKKNGNATTSKPKASTPKSQLGFCMTPVWLTDKKDPKRMNVWGRCSRHENKAGSARCNQHVDFVFPTTGFKATAAFTARAIERGLEKLFGNVADRTKKYGVQTSNVVEKVASKIEKAAGKKPAAKSSAKPAAKADPKASAKKPAALKPIPTKAKGKTTVAGTKSKAKSASLKVVPAPQAAYRVKVVKKGR